MTELDDELVPEVLSIIDEFGKLVSFITVVQVYDSTVGHTIETPTPVSRKITPPAQMSLRFVDGDLIQIGDMTALVAASGLTFEIKRGMNLEIDSLYWTVVDFKPIYTGDAIAAVRAKFLTFSRITFIPLSSLALSSRIKLL